jgi:hypothetical protein
VSLAKTKINLNGLSTGVVRVKNCCRNAKEMVSELLVYLVDEEKGHLYRHSSLFATLVRSGRILSATSVLSPWSIEQGKKNRKKRQKTLPYIPRYGETPEKGLRAVSCPTAVPISADKNATITVNADDKTLTST